MMEKRRRARINQSLNELKTLILEAMKKDVSDIDKTPNFCINKVEKHSKTFLTSQNDAHRNCVVSGRGIIFL